MYHNIKISVIIPIYNAEAYLEECLNSVINQTLQEIEIICVDDGSTDNSMEILKSFCEKDKRIIILQQENKYAGVARNTGLKVAKGKYLSFLDADDVFEPDMLRKAYDKAEKHQADCVIWDGTHFDNGTKIEKGSFLKKDCLPKDVFSPEEHADYLFYFTYSVTWNKLFSKSLAEKYDIWFEASKRTNDLYFVFVAMAHAEKICLLNEKLMKIRVGNPKSLQGSSGEDPTHIVKALLSTKARLIKDNLYRRYEKSFVNVALESCLHIMKKLEVGEGLNQFCRYLREHGFPELGLLDYPESYFYNISNYQEMKLISEKKELYEYFYALYQKEIQKKNEVKRYYDDKKVWLFPYEKIEQGAKIVLYGAGDVGQDYFKQLGLTGYATVVKWVDLNYKNIKNKAFEVTDPKTITEVEYDYIVIGIVNDNAVLNVRKFLSELLIEDNCIIDAIGEK